MNPIIFPAGAMTLILWLVWSDSIRPRRASKIVCWIRVGVFLVVGGLLIQNVVRYRAGMGNGVLWISVAAVLVALGGAGYFFQRARVA